MTPKADEILIRAAVTVREVAPDAWEHFVHCLRQYSAVTTAGMLRSPRDDLQTNQGKAQAIADLALLLQEAPRRFEALRNRRAQ